MTFTDVQTPGGPSAAGQPAEAHDNHRQPNTRAYKKEKKAAAKAQA